MRGSAREMRRAPRSRLEERLRRRGRESGVGRAGGTAADVDGTVDYAGPEIGEANGAIGPKAVEEPAADAGEVGALGASASRVAPASVSNHEYGAIVGLAGAATKQAAGLRRVEDGGSCGSG